QEVEAAFLSLRASIETRDAQLEPRAARLDGLLEKADSRASGGGLVAFVGALAIALREGVEAALLVAAMLALLRKAGRERDADAVHVGWVSASLAAAAVTGLLALVGLVAAFQRVGRRLRPRPLLVTCGILLCALAVLMVGHGVRSLQILGAVPLTIWGAFQVPALGLYATREGLCAQALVVMALAGSALWTALRRD